MPRYLVEFDALDDTARQRARALAVERFPEVEIERRAALEPESSARERWECRAPSDAHVRRWSAAAGFTNATTRQAHTHHNQEKGQKATTEETSHELHP